MEKELEDLLKESAIKWGKELSQGQIDAFDTHLRELKKWNASMNITSIEGDKEVVVKHFIDSLSALPFIPSEGFLMDIGSGGGFPGLPIKISIPSLRVLLLDSSQKKIVFLKNLIRGLGLKGIEALSQRAENKGFQEVMKATVDVVISRATLSLDSFIPAGAPYVKGGGILIAMRGKGGTQEIQDSRAYQDKFGLRVEKVEELSLPMDMGKRTLIILRKV